jgi:uncharacterized protein
MCIGCRERKKKEEMIRFTRGAEGVLLLNEGKPSGGRGLYLCPNLRCLKLAQKKNRMGQVLGIHGSPISIEARLAQ